MKKTYTAPELEKFGTVTDLSAGGSAGAPETMDGPAAAPGFQRP